MKRLRWASVGLATALIVGASTAAYATTPPTLPIGGANNAFGSAGGQLQKQDLATGTAANPYVRTPALAVTNKGTLIAAYDPRPSGSDLPSNMSLVIRSSNNNGRTWGTTQVVRSSPAPDGFSDPSLLVDHRTGRIFLFYAASVNEGFGGSATGNSNTDPNVLQADVSYSDNNGKTWTNEVITNQIKNPAWNGIFAASGEGIQLTTGPHAGRLVQQYVVGNNGGEYAASAYSDNNGASWQMGSLVGPGMNENKTVQLSNGNVLLDVRDAPNRLLATSTDGGVSYNQPVANAELPDPDDNGSIIRFAPNAPANSPQSHWLLESNNDSTSTRGNLVVKLSCDNGQTWPVTKSIEPGSAGYSTLTNLPNGGFGLLYERNNYTEMTYTSFDAKWIDGACGNITPAGTSPIVVNSSTTSVPVQVTNTGATPLSPGRLTLAAQPGWTTGSVSLPELKPGASRTVAVPATITSSAVQGAVSLQATLTTRTGQSQGTIPVTVISGTPAWSTNAAVTTDGVHAVDESANLPAVSGLSGGTVAITFSTTQSTAAGVLLSAADPTSNVRDLVVSLNSGKPYVEIRTNTNSYPVRISSSTLANDGKTHLLTVTSNASGTTLAMDGTVLGTTSTQAFFNTVPGLANLTLGANVASAGTRWQFAGTIDSAAVYGPGA